MGQVLDEHLRDQLLSLSTAYVSATAKVAAELSSRPIKDHSGSNSPSHLAEDEAEQSAIVRQINKLKGTTTEKSPPAYGSCQP